MISIMHICLNASCVLAVEFTPGGEGSTGLYIYIDLAISDVDPNSALASSSDCDHGPDTCCLGDLFPFITSWFTGIGLQNGVKKTKTPDKSNRKIKPTSSFSTFVILDF